MTKTIKQQLQDLRSLDKAIDGKQAQIDRLRSRALYVGSMDYSRDRVQGSGCLDPTAVLDKAMDLEREITADIDRLVDLKREWRRRMEMLSVEQSTLLELRYFEGHPWEEICVKISYSWRQVHRLHSRGLIELEKMAHNGTL